MFKNHDELIEELANKIMNFDIVCNRYQTDVYGYYDPETETARFEEYVNIDGSSRIADNHYVVYVDEPHYTHLAWEMFTNEEDVAHALNVPVDQLRKDAAIWAQMEESELDFWDIMEYAIEKHIGELITEMRDALWLDFIAEYREKAEELIETWESEVLK